MHKRMTQLVPAWLLLLLAVCLPVAGQEPEDSAQDEEPVYDENTAECITLRNVRRTEVLDDRNILFHMRGKTVYHNILPRSCGGLAREDRFSYQTSIGRLCRLDHIRVLYNDPFGLREGNRCALGIFHKMDDEDAKALRDGMEDDAPVANPLPMPKPEEVGEGNEE
jgi:hypothetical protein